MQDLFLLHRLTDQASAPTTADIFNGYNKYSQPFFAKFWGRHKNSTAYAVLGAFHDDAAVFAAAFGQKGNPKRTCRNGLNLGFIGIDLDPMNIG